MTPNEKRSYYSSYKNLANKLKKQFYPLVEKALREQIKFFTDAYKEAQYVTPEIIPVFPMKQALKRLHIVAGLNNAQRVSKWIKRDLKKNAADDQVTKWTWVINEYLRQNGLDNMSIEITNTLRKKIKSILVQGNTEGWGVVKMVAELNDATFPRWMAQRIVRTEINKATNTGAMVAAADSGVVVNKEWISTQDNRTRRIPRDQYDHLHMDELQVGFSERFIVPSTRTVDAMLYPGDPAASVGNIVNCRCTVAFVPVRNADGTPVPATIAQPNGTGGVFYELLRQAATIGVTNFLVAQLLNE